MSSCAHKGLAKVSFAQSGHMCGINYAGTQATQWDFQNKGKSGWTGTSSFVVEVPLCNLRPSVINSIPCDQIVQRAYSKSQIWYWKVKSITWNSCSNALSQDFFYIFRPSSTNFKSKNQLAWHNIQYHMKVLLNSFNLNGHTVEFFSESKILWKHF